MSLSLAKGQKIDLSKDYESLDLVLVGLGWDPVKSDTKGKSFFKRKKDIDCDAFAIKLVNGKFESMHDVIYFNNLHDSTNSVVHRGDNLTGYGEGDDEQILVTLSKVDPKYTEIVIAVNIFSCVERKQNFGMIENAFIRLVDNDGGKELMRYDLSGDYSESTAVIFGKLYRKDDHWKFAAIGTGTNDTSIENVARRFV